MKTLARLRAISKAPSHKRRVSGGLRPPALMLLLLSDLFRAGLFAGEPFLQSLNLLSDFLFAVRCRKEHVIRVFELPFPFLFHMVEVCRLLTLVLLQGLGQFLIGLGARVFQ